MGMTLEKYRKLKQERLFARQEAGHRYHAKVRGCQIDKVSYPAILEQYGMHCYLCGQDIEQQEELTFDHVVPLSKGGTHSQDNIRPTHMHCNYKKGDKIL